MLDIALIRERPDWVKQQLAKLYDETALVRIDNILALDAKRRQIRTQTETAQAARNRLNRAMGKLRGSKKMSASEKAARAAAAATALKQEDYEAAGAWMDGSKDLVRADDDEFAAAFEGLIGELKNVGGRIDGSFAKIKAIEAELEENMLWIPNLPHETVAVFASEEHNIPCPPRGKFREFEFEPRPHWEIGPELGIIDFERGVKLAGSRHYILKGWGARLHRALISFFLDTAQAEGFTELYVPYMAYGDMLYGSAQFPKFRDTVYSIDGEDKFLLPTAEVAITNMHRGEIFDEADLPLHYVAHTPCFRSEKASAGRDVRGIKRVHQFEKVEMYKFTTPETSYDALERLTQKAERICAKLEIPYRRLEIVSGDLGFSATKKYDIEVWSPGCREWLEVSSCSNTEAFQARRAMVRYYPGGSRKTRFVHTLNGSGLAAPRVMIAIMENGQQADGSVLIPEVLRPYLGGADAIRKP